MPSDHDLNFNLDALIDRIADRIASQIAERIGKIIKHIDERERDNDKDGRRRIPDELLTVQELTELLKIKRSWVYQRVFERSLPFPYVKVGAYLRFPLSGVQAYIRAQKPTSERL